MAGIGNDEPEVGNATGWRVEEDTDGSFRWAAFGPHGSREGHAGTRAEAEAAAQRAEQELTDPAPPR